MDHTVVDKIKLYSSENDNQILIIPSTKASGILKSYSQL